MHSDLTQQILHLQRGDHLCLFYDKEASEQMPALVPYIQQGLKDGERCIYIADDQTVEELAGHLSRHGVNVADESGRGRLKLWTRKQWRQPGRLDSRKKAEQVRELIDEAMADGCTDVRFAVEMTWTLGPNITARDLEHWEATINTLFGPGKKGRIVCQYNRSRLSPEAILAALHTHPLAVLGEQVCPNAFYQAPVILGRNGNRRANAEAQANWMIGQLRQAREAEQQRQELMVQRRTQQSDARLRQVLSLMPAAVYTCDAEGRITFYNERAAELWGAKPALSDDQCLFCGSYKLYKDGVLTPPEQMPMADVLRTGVPVRDAEVMIERPDGTRSDISVNIDPILGADGRVDGAINVFQDISGRKRAEETSQRLAAIVESSNDAIVSKNLNGTITSWNQAAERIFGYTASEAIGQHITLLIPAARLKEEEEIIARIKRGERLPNYETVRRRKDGTLIDVALTISPLRGADGRIIGASKIAQDISERKEAERTIRALSTPVLEVQERMLVLPIVGTLDDERSTQLTDQLLSRIREHRARVAVLDLTGMASMDTRVANRLRQTIQAARLLGATTIISGISRHIADILTRIGFTADEAITVGNLRAGIEIAGTLLKAEETNRKPEARASGGTGPVAVRSLNGNGAKLTTRQPTQASLPSIAGRK